MSKTKISVILVISIFLLMQMNQVVAADVQEKSRTFYIQPNPDVDYLTSLNIINGTNNNFTNNKLLIEPFTTQSGIDGGYSGSFLPPVKFQLNDAMGTDWNTHLVLSSIVEFNRKNLLSGASESWWRCPYYYNATYNGVENPDNQDWDLTLSIYHVNTPRTANFSFEHQTGVNWPLVPTAESRPSLIFTRYYEDCGKTQDWKQWNYSAVGKLPTNDTLEFPDLPLQLNPSEPDYNRYRYMYDDTYNHTINYDMAWFNVTAPIYPNESYMVVWDIHDADLTDNDAGSFWLTATDIGNNYYGRTIVSWNSIDVYELPLDLDSSVIFRTGMGAGVSGTKLDYINNANYLNHNILTNPSFEASTPSTNIQEPFNDPITTTWTTTYEAPYSEKPMFSLWASVLRFRVEDTRISGTTPSLTTMDYTPHGHGTSVNFDLSMQSQVWYDFDTSPNDAYYSSSFHFILGDLVSQQAEFKINKWKYIPGDGMPTITHNELLYNIGGGLWFSTMLPETFPENLYISVITDPKTDAPNTNFYLYIYDQDVPNSVYFATKCVNVYNGPSVAQGITVSMMVQDNVTGSIQEIQTDSILVFIGHIDTLVIIEAWENMPGWVFPPTAAFKQDFWTGLETVVPDMNPTTNTNCIEVIHQDSSAQTSSISQLSGLTGWDFQNRRYFVECQYSMMPVNESQNYANSYFELKIGGVDSGGFVTYETYTYYMVDGTWHGVGSGHVDGYFERIHIIATFYFPATIGGVVDVKYGMVDNFKIYSITDDLDGGIIEFHQKIEIDDLTDTNFMSLMIPIKQSTIPDFAPYAELRFRNDAGTLRYRTYTLPSDFYGDFILSSIKSSELLAYPDITSVTIILYNFCDDAYMFINDRNSDFNLNDDIWYRYNYYRKSDIGDYVTTTEESFFSPFYSLRATEGQWVNADSSFTTTYFYYVTVRYVHFVDNDVEIISVVLDTVDAGDLEAYRMNLKSFGDVYDAKEWLAYLEVRNRQPVGAFDKIMDSIINSDIGQFVNAIGKFIWKIIVFLVKSLAMVMYLILEVIAFMVPLLIYAISTWIVWNFTKFWILLGQNRVEEGIAVLTNVTGKITSVAVSVGSKVAKGGKG